MKHAAIIAKRFHLAPYRDQRRGLAEISRGMTGQVIEIMGDTVWVQYAALPALVVEPITEIEPADRPASAHHVTE